MDKLSKNLFTKLQRLILGIFEDTKPKAEERRAGVRVLGQTHARVLPEYYIVYYIVRTTI